MASPGSRPISPHLGIYTRGPHMMVSIIHRITGDGLAIVGTLMLLWWLGALASGPEAYATFLAFARGPIGMIILVGLTWALFQHLASGVRHLVLDMGAGYELRTSRRWSRVVLAAGVVMTALFWAFIFLRGNV